MRFATLFLLAALMAPLATAQANLSGVVINEILADPNSGADPSMDFDTDGDGTSETDDEFVEFYNTSSAAVDISGWQVYQVSSGAAVLAHTFAASTEIAAGGYIVVVGAWDPGTPPAGIVVGSEGPLGLSNGGDEVFLFDPTANQYIGAYYNGAQTAVTIGTGATLAGEDDFGDDTDQLSIQRSPDGSTTLTSATPTPNAANSTAPVPVEYMALLLGANEVPAVDTDAAGGVTAVLTGDELVVTGRFDDLGSAYAASHIHIGAAGTNGGVVQALSPTVDADELGGTFEAASNTFTLSAANVTALENGELYVNIHSADNGGGEIRGQLLEDVPTTAISLRQARIVGAGYSVTVSGTVSRAAGDFTYFQSEDGGLTIRQTSGDFADAVAGGTIQSGTELTVTGTLSEFNDLLQINGGDLDSYTVDGDGDAPEPVTVTLADLAADGEFYEGRLVTVADAEFADAGGMFALDTSYDISDASSTTNDIVVRVPRSEDDTDVEGTTIPSGSTNITGVVGDFRGSYQIFLIEASDLAVGTAGETGPEADGFALASANPLRAGGALTLSAPVAGEATLELFDVVGRRVATLVDGPVMGEQTVRLSDTLASGVYVLRLTTASGSLARTITIVR